MNLRPLGYETYDPCPRRPGQSRLGRPDLGLRGPAIFSCPGSSPRPGPSRSVPFTNPFTPTHPDDPPGTCTSPSSRHSHAASLQRARPTARLRPRSLVASHPGGKARVCDMAGAFDTSQPTISHHGAPCVSPLDLDGGGISALPVAVRSVPMTRDSHVVSTTSW